jgi:hypothetical protein
MRIREILSELAPPLGVPPLGAPLGMPPPLPTPPAGLANPEAQHKKSPDHLDADEPKIISVLQNIAKHIDEQDLSPEMDLDKVLRRLSNAVRRDVDSDELLKVQQNTTAAKKLIKNIDVSGGVVTFQAGDQSKADTDKEMDPSNPENVVGNMAKKALKRRQ